MSTMFGEAVDEVATYTGARMVLGPDGLLAGPGAGPGNGGRMPFVLGAGLLFAFATLAAPACQGEAHPAGARLVVSDSAGVELVDNEVDPARVPRLTLEEELRIGSVEGPPETQFDLVRRVALAPTGDIYVALLRANEIRVFDSGGGHLRTFGRTGEGPGEFSSLANLYLAGDTIVALDMRLYRTTALSLLGEVLGTANLIRLEGGIVTPMGPFADGWLFEVPDLWDWPEHGRSLERTSSVVLAPSGDIGVALGLVEGSSPEVTPIFDYSYGRSFGMDQAGVRTTQRPLWEPALQSWASDGRGRLYVPARDRYRIDVFDERGALVRRIRRTHQPVPITSDLKRAYLNHVVAHHDTVRVQTEFGTDPVDIQRFRAELPPPAPSRRRAGGR